MLLSTQYDFLPRFLKLLVVNLISNLMIPFAGLCSLAFLGHLSEIRHFAGTAQATIFFDFTYYVASFLRQSTTGVTAQAVGKNDREEIFLVALRNSLIALGLGLLILVFQSSLGNFYFSLLSSTTEVKLAGLDYYHARILGAPAALVNFVILGWLLGREDNNKVLFLSLFGNLANIILDYLFIIHLGWETTGAGLSQAISQYLVLLGGLIFFCLQIQWQELATIVTKLTDISGFKSAIFLNFNIFLSTLILVFTLNLFSLETTTMESLIYIKDALILQLVYLALYGFEGVGFATESLAGNFKGQGIFEKFLPLIFASGAINLFLGISFSSIAVLFPQTVFGLLTDHSEATENIEIYAWWLIFVLGFSSIAFLLEGYFLGLAEGGILRNMSFLSIGIGYLPIALVSWQVHNNHLLWLSLTMFMLTKAILLGMRVPKTLLIPAPNETES